MASSTGAYLVVLGVMMTMMVNGIFAQDCQAIIINAMNEYKACVDYSYRMLFGLQYNNVITSNNYEIINTCRSIRYIQCQQAATQKVAGCTDFMQKEALDITFRATHAGFRFFCDDHGRNLIEFYRRRVPDCYFTHQSYLHDCEREFPLVNIYLRSYTPDYCRSQSSVMQCLQSVYDRCLPNQPTDFIRMYLNSIWMATPCSTGNQQFEYLLSAGSTSLPQSLMTFALVSVSLLLFSRWMTV